jgi:DNA-binding FrmR family transcriptional regulator
MDINPEMRVDVMNRLKRARGQIDGIVAMLDDGRTCTEVVTQIAAVSKALERVGFKVIASELTACVENGDRNSETKANLEKLFLSLA